jgi:hypothetical protein
MKNLFLSTVIAAVVFFGIGMTAVAQSVANYTPARVTGITYNSISSIGNSVSSWRHNDPLQMLDDNRSNPIPIGFDFWYDGVRHTTLSVGINGIADFSASAATGFTPGDYDSDNPTHNRLSNTTTPQYAWNCLAVMYGDLTTQNQVDPLGTSFMYLTTGVAPNRVFTLEWINLSVWNQINTGTSWNFQLKLYESTGTFEFIYGTMTSGTATLEYKTGYNAPDLSGGLSSAVLMIQQVANSTTFLPQRIPGTGCVTTLPESNSKLVFTPPIPANPTNLTFTLVGQTSMTLNWNDNANNEVGYAVYSSSDGVNYSYTAQVAANSISYTASGLSPATTYYWKVYAVTEGGLSASVNNSQSTTAATNFTSAQSGTWNTSATWGVSGVPTANANVTIANGHTVTIDGDITINNITVATGGILLIGNDNTARTLNVLGSITVNAGAQFLVNTISNTSNHQLNITGDILNNNIFDLASDADSRCQITFNRAGNQLMSGTGASTRFYLMNLNMGSTNSNALDVTASNFLTQSTGFLTITNGTFKYEAPNAITPFIANTTIPLTGGLWVNNSSAVVTTTGGNLSYTGFVRVTAGTLNIGTAVDQQLLSNGGDIIIEGGVVNVAGSFNRTNNVTITKFTMTGGTLRVAAVGSTSTTLAPFLMDIFGSSFTMSGGGIVVVREGGTGANDLGYINTGSTTYSMSGGMLQIGDYTTPAGQTMQINTNKSVFNFIDSSANATAQLVASLTASNNVLIAAGTLNANNLNISVGGNWTNQGTFTPGTGTVTFIGSTGSIITKATGEAFNNLTINKSSNAVSLGGAVTVSGTLTMTQGNIALAGNTLTLGTAAASPGTLTYTGGFITGTGTFKRWFNTSAVTLPSATGQFPMGVGTNNRNLWVAGTPTTGGTVSVQYTDANTKSAISFTELSNTFVNRYDASWTVATANSFAGSSLSLQIQGSGISGISSVVDLTISGPAAAAAGSPLATSGTTSDPVISRNGLTAATLASTPFYIASTSSSALPVEMTSFTAVLQGTGVLLKWATATEMNNSGFQIDRSVEGSNVWAEVVFVKGAGTSSSPKTYSYEDKNLAPGKYVYRIKQIDNDGKTTIYNPNELPTVDAGVSTILQLCSNYPNPFNPTTNMQFSVPQDGYASLKIYNILGQEVATLFAGMAKAGHYIPATFNASRLASGIYFARLQYSGKSLVQRMLLTK